MRSFSLSLLLSVFFGLAATAAPTPADTARLAKHHTAKRCHIDQSRTGLEIYQGPLSRQLDWLGDSSAVVPTTDPTPTSKSALKGTATLRSPRAQARAITRERVRQGWGNQRRE